MNFTDWSVEEVIELLNWTKERSISARFADAQIPALLPMLFTTNRGMTGRLLYLHMGLARSPYDRFI